MLNARHKGGPLLLATTLLLIVGLTACGDGVADGSAVKVGSTSISEKAVAHWMSVIAGEVSTAAGKPEPPVPDPPHYGICVAFRRKYPQTFLTDPTSASMSTLLNECQSEFQKEKLKALYYLITDSWVNGEAVQLGVRVTSKDVEQELSQLYAHTPSKAVARRVLVGARGTTADLHLSLKLSLLIKKVQQKLEADMQQLTTAQRQQALERFGHQFEKRWVARTVCRREDLVPICKNFKAPGIGAELVPPEIPLTNLTAE